MTHLLDRKYQVKNLLKPIGPVIEAFIFAASAVLTHELIYRLQRRLMARKTAQRRRAR